MCRQNDKNKSFNYAFRGIEVKVFGENNFQKFFFKQYLDKT